MTICRLLRPGALALPAVLLLTGAQPASPAAHVGVHVAQQPGDILAIPPAPWADADPADSLYRAGREAINHEQYRRAAALFGEITRRFPTSEYAPDAPYWRAFALYKAGREDDLREALRELASQQKQFPKARTASDASTLAVRIRGALAKRGDAASAEAVTTVATETVSCSRGGRDDDNDLRTAAMNALLQMEAQSAIPIIKQVLQKRDACSATLREKAVFLLSQKQTPESEALLIDVVRNDPSRQVREQAIFWMGQVHTEKAASLLEEIATSSPDMAMREKAIFALSQQSYPGGAALLRRFAERSDTPASVREQAVFWLGQRSSQDNADFLRSLFGKLGKSERDDAMRKTILFSLSQMRGFGNDRWLLSIALDNSNSEELRGHALWTAGQAGIAGSELISLYDRLSDAHMKEKLIFVLAQSFDRASTDKLIEIAQKDPDREMRKKALFWLGQRNDPSIRQLLLDIITKP